ncbi:unnamed protein product [Fusarium venenatum]|uniref:Uncharacterized protein n=1 Tax=Fusarium venenatum TaxID=56646 RepID=A0A2L2TL29_9HYPO|nr:uncharacterized protein FVRRES_05496 [Fusarium venenatum]CEI61060.1 unnamed protein product [Fusarium venenatum]
MPFSSQKYICVGAGQDYLNMSRRDPNNTAANGWRSGKNPVLATPGENFAKLRWGWSGLFNMGVGDYHHDKSWTSPPPGEKFAKG